MALRMAQPRFANARGIRNAIDWLRVARDDLIEITAADVRASRVFEIPAEGVASRASSAAQDGDL